jgi:hypothetical protein
MTEVAKKRNYELAKIRKERIRRENAEQAAIIMRHRETDV